MASRTVATRMGTGFLGRWVVANAIGELLGLGAGALLAVLALARIEGLIGVVPAAIVSAIVFGLVEGTVVGEAQHRAMHPLPQRPDRRPWVIATAVGGTVAWLAASLPFALLAGGADTGSVASVDEPALTVQLAVMAALGVPAGAVLGVPQALVLRRHTTHPWRWVGANALAWAVGLPVVQLVAGGFPSSPPIVLVATLGVVALLSAGAVVGAIHGPTLHRLLTDDVLVDAPPPTPLANVITMWWIRNVPAPLRPRRLAIVEYRSSAGRPVALPVVAVPYGEHGSRVVVVGNHDDKRWWRRFRHPTPATLTDRDGRSRPVIGTLPDQTGSTDALAAYLADQPRAASHVTPETPVVVFGVASDRAR